MRKDIMATKKRSPRHSRPIISGHLEKVSSRVFGHYSKVITDMIRGRQGIYALYKKDKLYYVGLATELRRRITQHLRDRHQGKWNLFSLYVIRKDDHIKEIESVVLRIAYPVGNTVKGKLKGSENLLAELDRGIRAEQDIERRGIIDQVKKRILGKKRAKRKKKTVTKRTGKNRPLKQFFRTGKMIYATHKGKAYKAWVRPNGGISYGGATYDTPSGAGKAVRGKATNGWAFWKYKDKNGELKPLKSMRE